MNKSNTPQIRFNGFSEDWEIKPLEEIFLRIRNAFVGTATPYYVSRGHFYLESNNIKNGLINRKTEIFINDDFHYKQKDKWLKTGDIVMVQSGHVGHSAVIPQELNNSAAHALIMFTNYKQETNPYFLNYQFLTEKTKLKIDKVTTGNTIKHILSSDMKLFECSFSDIGEQNKIGVFFQNIDQTILLQRRKHKQMQTLKQSLLAKMFPQVGKNEPDIRLKGFSGDCVEVRLGDISNTTIGEFVIKTRQSANGAYPVYNGGISYTGHYSDFNSEANKIVISARGANAGFVNIVRKRYWAGNSCYSVEIDIKETSINFLYYFIKQNQHLFTDYQQAANIPSVSKRDVEEFKINLPNLLEEQTAIGEFFKQFDDTLTLQAKQLKTLENIKKALLAKMFV